MKSNDLIPSLFEKDSGKKKLPKRSGKYVTLEERKRIAERKRLEIEEEERKKERLEELKEQTVADYRNWNWDCNC